MAVESGFPGCEIIQPFQSESKTLFTAADWWQSEIHGYHWVKRRHPYDISCYEQGVHLDPTQSVNRENGSIKNIWGNSHRYRVVCAPR